MSWTCSICLGFSCCLQLHEAWQLARALATNNQLRVWIWEYLQDLQKSIFSRQNRLTVDSLHSLSIEPDQQQPVHTVCKQWPGELVVASGSTGSFSSRKTCSLCLSGRGSFRFSSTRQCLVAPGTCPLWILFEYFEYSLNQRGLFANGTQCVPTFSKWMALRKPSVRSPGPTECSRLSPRLGDQKRSHSEWSLPSSSFKTPFIRPRNSSFEFALEFSFWKAVAQSCFLRTCPVRF